MITVEQKVLRALVEDRLRHTTDLDDKALQHFQALSAELNQAIAQAEAPAAEKETDGKS